MNYRLSIPRSVNKRMERLPTEVYERIDSAILALADVPRPPGCVKLKGREDWRIRGSETTGSCTAQTTSSAW